MGLLVWPTLNGVAVGDGPIFTAISAEVVMTELGQFTASSIVLPAADRRAILAMRPFTLLEIVQDGVGTIAYGTVLDPHQQIADNGDHTITVDLAPLTDELTRYLTGRGWIAATWLTVVATRLATLAPGWSCDPSTVGFGGGGDFHVSVTANDDTALAAFLDTARRFGQYARLGVDATGAPVRTLEMGQFGAAPTVTLASADGGDPDRMAANGTVRVVATVEYQPNDVSQLVNVVTPVGGGTGDSLVTLERLWRIINDGSYPNYAKYGDAPGSVFPEYDPFYPIKDPVTGDRVAALDGQYLYPVYDYTSYFGASDGSTPAYGHMGGQFIDSSLTYADNSPANQELTARALYLSTIANFKRFAHPHQLFTCTATDATARPTRAGDLIWVDYRRVSTDETGAVVEMAVVESLRVMRVVRSFRGDAPPVDTYTLSNLGRFDETDATAQADTARQLVALQINQGTSIAPLAINDRGNVDALHPLVTHISVPAQLFRWQRCNLRVDFQAYTATIATATNPAGTPVVAVGSVAISLPTPADINALAANIGGVPKHIHQMGVSQTSRSIHIGSTPIDITPDRYLWLSGGGSSFGLASNGTNTTLFTDTPITSPDLTPTSHPHVVAKAKDIIAHIPAGQVLADLPQHVHPLDQHIPDGPLPVSCTVDINGSFLSSGLALLSGTRNGDGSFSSSFEVDDISPLLNAITGDLTVTLHAGTGAGNPFGTGMFVLSMTLFGEYGGLTSNVRAI